MLKLTRRKVQIALGLIWLFDGMLQLQPAMFSSKFISEVIQPAIAGQPFYIYDPVHLAVRIFLTHPAIFNSFIVVTQISIGLLILKKSTAKYGLLLSIGWGLIVWFFGEALAGMLAGSSSLLMGLPGAAIIYVLIATATIPKKNDEVTRADSWLVYIWTAIWLIGGIFMLLPAQDSTSSLKSMIMANAHGAPHWLAGLDKSFGTMLNHLGASSSMGSMSMAGTSGYVYILLIASLFFFIGIGPLLNRTCLRIAICLGIIFSVIFWFVGQSLGGYYTGVMTDVQTAPLLILLGLIVISQPKLNLELKKAYQKLEKILA